MLVFLALSSLLNLTLLIVTTTKKLQRLKLGCCPQIVWRFWSILT